MEFPYQGFTLGKTKITALGQDILIEGEVGAMFTGIIEETGILLSVQGGASGSRLVIKAGRILEDIKKGDSIAVNGVCLTAASFDSGCFLADVMPETLKRSNLGQSAPQKLSLTWNGP